MMTCTSIIIVLKAKSFLLYIHFTCRKNNSATLFYGFVVLNQKLNVPDCERR